MTENNMCRFCLNKSHLHPIFVNLEKCDRYTAVLALTTGLKVEPNDGFSQQICRECTKLVNSAIKFRNQCHLCHIKILKSNLLIKNLTAKPTEDHEKLPEFQIEVDFQRVSDCESGGNSEVDNNIKDGGTNDGGKSDSQDGRLNQNGDTKVDYKKSNKQKDNSKSRYMKTKMYLDMVDGVFDPKGPVKCKICKKTLSKWACFVGHTKLHLGSKYICEHCGKNFLTTTHLKRHCRSYHGMPRELACQYCSYLALDKAQLVLHERRLHTLERPYECDACGATYHSRRTLLQHLEGHRTSATVQCENCPLKFKSARHLARHRYSVHVRNTKKQQS